MRFIFDIETTGLDPMKDRILCITLQNVEQDSPASFYGEDEKLILQQFWMAIGTCEAIIGFNSEDFDIPFLIKRSIINDVKVKKDFISIDLRKVANGFKYSYNKYTTGKLKDWAEILGYFIQTEDGEMMPQYYEQKNWKAIRAHCEEDVLITHKLFHKINRCGLI